MINIKFFLLFVVNMSRFIVYQLKICLFQIIVINNLHVPKIFQNEMVFIYFH